jgi:hypothetical protein
MALSWAVRSSKLGSSSVVDLMPKEMKNEIYFPLPAPPCHVELRTVLRSAASCGFVGCGFCVDEALCSVWVAARPCCTSAPAL